LAMKEKNEGNGILCKFYGKTCGLGEEEAEENFVFHLADERERKKVLNKLEKKFSSSPVPSTFRCWMLSSHILTCMQWKSSPLHRLPALLVTAKAEKIKNGTQKNYWKMDSSPRRHGV
jgi:hypothetical protein